MKNLKPVSKNLLAKIGAVCLLSMSLTSCLKDKNVAPYNPPAALVSFTQASPDEPPINFFLNADLVNQFYAINFGQSLDYFRAYTGQRTAIFYNAGTQNMLLSDTVTFNQNAIYSLFLANKASSPELVVLKDTLNQPAAGMASIRFINLSPDAPAVSLAIQGGATLAANKPYKAFSSFTPVAGSKSYTFQVLEGTTVVATLSGVNISNGFVYTMWFHGLASGTTSNDQLGIGILTNAYYY